MSRHFLNVQPDVRDGTIGIIWFTSPAVIKLRAS